MVISKDTDMLVLLALIAPSQGDIVLRLDYCDTVDFVSIRAFRSWLETQFGSVYNGFLLCVLQGNDYVPKVSMRLGPASHLEALRRLTPGGAPLVRRSGDHFELDEEALIARLRQACTRGALRQNAQVVVRQAWWYLFYALHQCNASHVPVPLCVEAHEGASLFGWTAADGEVACARAVTPSPPSFVIV